MPVSSCRSGQHRKMKTERVRRFPLFPVMGPAASSGAAKRRFLQRPPARFLFSARRTDGCATAMHPSGTGIQSPDTGRHNIFPFPPGLSFFSVCSGTPGPPRHGAIRHNPVSCHAPRRFCPIFFRLAISRRRASFPRIPLHRGRYRTTGKDTVFRQPCLKKPPGRKRQNG